MDSDDDIDFNNLDLSDFSDSDTDEIDENVQIGMLLDEFLTCARVLKTNERLKGVCILTLALNRSSLCGCFVFDFDNWKILKHYPARYPCSNPIYKTINGERLTINIATDLPACEENGKHTGVPEVEGNFPFCCSSCVKQSRRGGHVLTNEKVFIDFINHTGTSEYTFKVVKKIQFGPLEFIKYFSLVDGKVTEKMYNESEHQENSFNIYTCSRHNTYFTINLIVKESTANFHHARGQNETLYGPEILNLMKGIVNTK